MQLKGKKKNKHGRQACESILTRGPSKRNDDAQNDVNQALCGL